MAKLKKTEQPAYIDIEAVSTLSLDLCILGISPFLSNRLSEKARHELLLPAPPKNRAEKLMRLKHVPTDEFRSSVYRCPDDDAPTRIVYPGAAFSKAIAAAALDIPGSSKAQISRLVKVVEYNVHLYGVPRLSCMIVRQAGINKTPDVRTRAVLPEWAACITMKFPHPLLTEKAILTLLAAAGEFVGVGDGRPEKGSGLGFGCFAIVAANNPDFVRVRANGGLNAQDKALEEAAPYDTETQELLTWFDAELERRDRTVPKNGRKAKQEEVIA